MRSVRLPRQKEVRRFEIAVHDPERVRVRDRFDRLEDAIGRALHREWPGDLEVLGQVHPVEVLEDHVRRAVLEGAHVHYARDVIARDSRRLLGIAIPGGDRQEAGVGALTRDTGLDLAQQRSRSARVLTELAGS